MAGDDDPGRCPHCGAVYEYHRKWDGGRDHVLAFPTCTCEEERTEKRNERLIEGMRQRREARE